MIVIWFRFFIQLLFLFLSPHSVNYWGRGAKISNHDLQIFNFSHSVTQFLLYEFWSPIIRCKVKILMTSCWVSSVQFSRSVVSGSLQPHELQHARPPCPSPTPGVYSNSCPLSRWCHPAISSSVVLFPSRLQSFPTSGSFPMSQFFSSGGQSIGASASVLPMKIQGWFPLGLTGLISLQSKRLWRVFFNTTVQKCQFFSSQHSL